MNGMEKEIKDMSATMHLFKVSLDTIHSFQVRQEQYSREN